MKYFQELQNLNLRYFKQYFSKQLRLPSKFGQTIEQFYNPLSNIYLV